MKLLVTGGLGFIGSNFISRVFENHENWSVVNVDAELYGSNHQSLEKFENNSIYNLGKKEFFSKEYKKDKKNK